MDITSNSRKGNHQLTYILKYLDSLDTDNNNNSNNNNDKNRN